MKSAKIIVTGPAHAGTTTFIRSLSEIAVLTTERRLSAGTGGGRGEATVALDFGRVTINRDLVVYFFGTPADQPSTLASGPLAEGPIGVVVVVDASRAKSLEDAATIISFLRENSDVPFVVAANRLPPDDEKLLAGVRAAVEIPAGVPVIPCEVTERESSKRVVLALIDHIIDATPVAVSDAPAESE
jgi:uncharacterized protein